MTESSYPPKSVPIPRPEFIRYTCGFEDYNEYQHSGQEVFTMLDLAARRYAGKKINGFRRVLDFACGSGRVMQYVGDGPKLYGCDIAAPLVSFAKSVCTRANVFTNDFEPPLGIRGGLFDLVYAFSVFSHLAEDLEMRWLQELHRVGAPDCLYLLTVHGDWVIEATLGEERARAEAA